MPQLQQIAETYASQLFWLLLVFGILYFGIARAMLPKVGRVIESRGARIAGDLAEAQSAQTRASEAQVIQASTLAKAREEAHVIVGEATARTQAESAGRLATLDTELSTRAAEAEARIAAASSAASAELDKIAASAAADIVVRLTGEPSSDDAPAAEAAAQEA